MIKTIIGIYAFVFLTKTTYGQTDTNTLVDSLKYLQTDTLDCDAEIFWKVVARREKAVPFLIDKLTDLTPTKIKDPCKTTTLNVSEVAYYALAEIADLPIYRIAEMQFDYFDGRGCTGFHNWYFFSDSLAHKEIFKDKLRAWWPANFGKYKWVTRNKRYLKPCQIAAGISGRYKWEG